jgi:hypothetical protein
MSKGPTILWVVVALVVVSVIWAGSAIRRLGEAKRQIVTMGTFNVGRDLIASTNSALLLSIDPELRSQLSAILASTTHIASIHLGDEPAPVEGGRASSVLLLTNNTGEGVTLRLGLHDDSTHTLRFNVLSHRKITEPDGAANGSQPIRSETNQTLPAAGSRR